MKNYELSSVVSEADIQSKAYVHWKSWMETYTGLINQSFLDTKHTLERCIEMARIDKERNISTSILAKSNGKVVGFISFGKSRENLLNTGEIYALYVLNEYHNKKIGYDLMMKAIHLLSQYKQIVLWVLKGNNQAIRFYEKIGFVFTKEEKKVILGSENIELKMVYKQ